MTSKLVLLTCEVCGEQWGSVTKCEELEKRHCGFCCPKYKRAEKAVAYREHLDSQEGKAANER